MIRNGWQRVRDWWKSRARLRQELSQLREMIAALELGGELREQELDRAAGLLAEWLHLKQRALKAVGGDWPRLGRDMARLATKTQEMLDVVNGR